MVSCSCMRKMQKINIGVLFWFEVEENFRWTIMVSAGSHSLSLMCSGNLCMPHYCLFISVCLCVYVWKGHNKLQWC